MKDLVLGISAYYHDSAAVLLAGGDILAAAQEERFTRRKHDASFPAGAVRYVLAEAGARVEDLAAVCFYDKPFLKLERLLETYHALAPRGLTGFLDSVPVWIKEKMFMRKMLWEDLEQAAGPIAVRRRPPLLFSEHHLSHAASAFYPSPFCEAAVLTIDGVGEWATTTLSSAGPEGITILKELNFPHSPGLLYSAFTSYCGFRVNGGEYKLMGLAPYGDPASAGFKRYSRLITDNLVDLREDGSLLLNLDYFDFATGRSMCAEKKWERLFGLPRREPESDLARPYLNLALAIQRLTETIVTRLAVTARRLTGRSRLVMAGGVALNCVANGKLRREGIFDDIWIQPAAGDAGGALGAAYAAWHIHGGRERSWENYSGDPEQDRMRGACLGPAFEDGYIRRMIRSFGAVGEHYSDFNEICRRTAALMVQGAVIGWFQGRLEWGPRALGNRSIIADPRQPDIQKRLNLKIKNRESFRPLAPSVLAEEAPAYFDLEGASPYMLLTTPVRSERRCPLPAGYREMGWEDRLNLPKSDIPAVTHVDFSARVQTVHRRINEKYWRLIRTFRELTGCAVIVNTSFNVRGEPLVCSPEEAYQCFMRTDMDWLVIGNFMFNKKFQPRFNPDNS
ncbi:MAG: carbamoyltransferase [Desulfosudaceae bacterium]